MGRKPLAIASKSLREHNIRTVPDDENAQWVPRAEQPFKRRGQPAARVRHQTVLKRAGQRAARIAANYRAGRFVQEIADRHRLAGAAVRLILADVLGPDYQAEFGRELIDGQEGDQESAEATAALAEVARQRLELLREAEIRPQHPRLWTSETILDAIQEWHKLNNHPPRRADFERGQRGRYPSPARVVQVFGSWRAAIAVAGLPVPVVTAGTAPSWSDEAILQAIRQADWEGVHTSSAFRAARRRPSMGTIVTRLGSWTRARHLALGADQDESGAGPGGSASRPPAPTPCQ
ncbi:MAG: homing endonuclease associated repeat-containing protein [Trebonia sp.]